MIYFWQHRELYSWSMNALYKVIGISKQAFHQRMDLLLLQIEEEAQLLPVVRQIREDHPLMSSRKMYRLINPASMGRDRFEAFCARYGFSVEVKRSFQRTTNSLGVTRFENLIAGRELNGVNQVWVSDITYYRIGERFYYISFIMDLYSRRIVGYAVSVSLRTEETTLPALVMAIKIRKGVSFKGLILHSDGGGQYYSKEFLKLTREKGILNSMAESVYENAHAERVNGIIKNEYLTAYAPESFEELEKMLGKAVRMYNEYRPHKSLEMNSPMTFENIILSIPSPKPLKIKRVEAIERKVISRPPCASNLKGALQEGGNNFLHFEQPSLYSYNIS